MAWPWAQNPQASPQNVVKVGAVKQPWKRTRILEQGKESVNLELSSVGVSARMTGGCLWIAAKPSQPSPLPRRHGWS